MDYLKFVEHHRSTNADITIGCLPVDYERASDFGLMKIDEEGRIYVRAVPTDFTPSPHLCRALLWLNICCDATRIVADGCSVLSTGLCREAKGGRSGSHEGGHNCSW